MLNRVFATLVRHMTRRLPNFVASFPLRLAARLFRRTLLRLTSLWLTLVAASPQLVRVVDAPLVKFFAVWLVVLGIAFFLRQGIALALGKRQNTRH